MSFFKENRKLVRIFISESHKWEGPPLHLAILDLCRENGITFFLIEHDMDLVMDLCDPVIVMSEGKKLAEGAPHEIRCNERVLEAYLGGQYR